MGGTFCFISKIGLQFKYILLRDEKVHKLLLKIVGSVYCSQDPQTTFSKKTTLKLGPTVLFTHLKIILLQYFQFSAFSFQQ